MTELDKAPNSSSFLASHNEARRAAVRSVEITGAGLTLDGLTMVLAIDPRARLNTAEDVVVTFATVGGGNLSAQQIADQINAAVGTTVATVINVVDPEVIVLGGGLSNLQQLYVELPSRLRDYVFSDVCTTPVVSAKHGDSSGVRGAAWLWRPEELPAALGGSGGAGSP